ncbi:DUF624 domain-containing protein [Gracilibacillus caseinilyticus]|uniref:DUF624 domain-containing protein n=1 Tax=Gracilibacillus caseinilyticus TaxID=2932256 RepID=A0ABY4EVE2_9BACI|nr:DUF624 domain-containing protein [Gracilibacillus caseinilyticus]UOQ48370.1 DUF624 domain-containing protein [Gracilibacillus caseinilyticus]
MTGLTDRPLYKSVLYVYYFMVTNFHFMLANGLFILAFIFFQLQIENILLFYIALLPAGPALAALHATMGKFVREKDINPTKDFWLYYRKNVVIASKFWLFIWTLITIFIVDIHYANIYVSVLAPVFLILLIACLFIMLYAFPVLTKFEVKLKNLLLVSIYSFFRYFKTTLLHVSTLISLAIIYYFVSGLAIWFIMSIVVYFIMHNMQKPFVSMQEELGKE